MNQNSIAVGEIRKTVNVILQITEQIGSYCEGYSEKFPKAVRDGIPSFEQPTDQYTAEHFLFVAGISDRMSVIEKELSNLPTLMLEADRENDIDSIMNCNTILLGYDELKGSVNIFSEKCEEILRKKSQHSTVNQLFFRLCELKTKIKLYADLLNSIN